MTGIYFNLIEGRKDKEVLQGKKKVMNDFKEWERSGEIYKGYHLCSLAVQIFPLGIP